MLLLVMFQMFFLCSLPAINATCPAGCSCFKYKYKANAHKVVCRGENITSYPTNMPVNTKKIIFTNTNLTELQINSSLPFLSHLTVHSNSMLIHINTSALAHCCPILKKIRIYYNPISRIDFLRPLPQVRCLYLNDNKLINFTIVAEIFPNLQIPRYREIN